MRTRPRKKTKSSGIGSRAMLPALLAVAWSLAFASAAGATGISGTVTDTGKTPLQGIGVCAFNAAGNGFEPPVNCNNTSVSGEYELGLAAGSYKVRFASFGAPGYVSQFYKGKGTFAEADAVAVSGGKTTTGIDAEMQEGAAVTGTVTDSLSAPIEGLQVCTATSQFMVGECAMTDAGGHYTLAGLAPGEYKIVFTNNDGCGPEGCTRLNYLVQYWNNKSSFGEATPIALTAGEIESGVNAKMQKGASISGTVVNTAKSPLKGIQVCAMPVGTGFGDCRQTGSNGSYSLVGLSTGEYRISFQPEEGSYYLVQYYDHKDRFNQADILSVKAGEAKAGIGAELKEGGAVTGTVTDSSHIAIQGLQVCAYEAAGSQFGERYDCAPTSSGGEYRLRLPAGSYKVRFTNNFCGPEGCEQLNYVGQYYEGAESWDAATAVSVGKGATTAGIDAQMEEGAEISGTVTDAGEAPLKGIQVCARGASEEQNALGGCAQTNAAGEYTIPGLAAGDYRVEFTGNSCGPEGCFQLNYVRQFYDGKTRFEEADVLSLAPGDVETGIDAQMEEGAEISGAVTDTAEQPLEGIQVCAQDASGEAEEPGGCATTDANGEYTITGIPAGDYKVEFSGETCNEEGCFQTNWVRQYYDGKTRRDEADVLSLAPGDVETGIDAQMEEGAEISGTVTDTAEQPIEGIQVCVQDASGEAEEPAGCAQTDAAGEYMIAGIPAGSFKVEFSGETCNEEGCFQTNWVRQYYDGKSNFNEADVLVLGAGDVETGIDAQMIEGAEISGTVTDAAEQPIEGIQVCVQDPSGEGEESAGCAQTDANGEYTIAGIPPGSYKVEFSGETCNEEGCFQTNWVRQYYDGKSNFDEADVLSLASGAVETGIDAALEEGGTINGTVIDAASEAPIEGLVVCANPFEGEGISGCDSTDESGEYEIGGLPAGEYRVEFSNSICLGEEECFQSYYLYQWFDEKQGWDQADPVSVQAGQTTPEIDAALEEGGAIRGTVTDALGAPIQESGVCAYALGASEEEPTECTGTGEMGHYMLVVPAGVYKVGFYYLDWPAGYFNGKTDFGVADSVSVTQGTTHDGIDAVLRPAAPVNTAPPSLTGNPAVGQVLSCSKGSWEHDPTSFAYAWSRDATPIPGQSAPTYTVQTADSGHGISCEVTASNAGGSATAKSNTLQVPTTPAPPPAGLAEEAPKEVGIATAPATAKVRNGKAMLRLACKASVSCKGVVKLFSGSQIGKARFSIPAGQTKTIAVKLTSKGKQLLEKAGKKGLSVTLKGSGVRKRKLTLKPS